MFKIYFASQYTPTKNGSKLPKFSYKTEEAITSFDIKDDDILSINKSLNVGKVHRWCKLSVIMIKTFGNSVTFPLKLRFKTMINEGVFLKEWKKSNSCYS